MVTSHNDSFVSQGLNQRNRRQYPPRLVKDLDDYLQVHRDVMEAVPGICRRLCRLLAYKHAGLALYDSDSGNLRLRVQTGPTQDALPEAFSFPILGGPVGDAYRLRQPLLVDDLRLSSFPNETIKELLICGIRSGCWVPLLAAINPLGVLWVASTKAASFRADDVRHLSELARPISVALGKQLALQSPDGPPDRLETLPELLRRLAPNPTVGIVKCAHPFRVVDANDALLRIVGLTSEHLRLGLDLSSITPPQQLELNLQAVHEIQERGFCKPFETQYLRPDGQHVPVLLSGGAAEGGQSRWVGIVVDMRPVRSKSDFSSSATSSPRPPSEQGSIQVVEGPVLLKTWEAHLERALKHSTVLLVGDAGTGKATLAQAIHKMSQRSNGPLIRLDCAAFPAGLLEREMFGFDSGSFLGTRIRKMGKIESAQAGTLLLENVNELPRTLQHTLLRVLRRGEFHRLGGWNPIHVDFNLVATTKYSLENMVSSHQFRQDLFDRLSVCSIRVPPLREHLQDISTLATHFMRAFTTMTRHAALTIPPETMLSLESRQWPGNIQELRDLIERSVLLSLGPELLLDPDELNAFSSSVSAARTLREIEREHIDRVLQETSGVVGGKCGAASILGVKRTTLQYKIKKLKILAG